MPSFRRIALLAVAAPFALALAACGESADDGAPAGEPLAPIAAPAGTSWVETAAFTPEGGNRIGNPDAPIKLVEYASHTCPACAAFSVGGAAPLDEYVAKGIVSYEIRNQIHNPIDLTLAMLVRCGEPTAFHPLANQVWANLPAVMQGTQQDPAALNAAIQGPEAQRFQRIAQAAGLLDFFAARGISRDQAMQCLANTAQANQIAENSQTQSEELDVTGTPTFFLNGRKIDGISWAEIEPALQSAGAR
jgi:protein-disulfide isomerase